MSVKDFVKQWSAAAVGERDRFKSGGTVVAIDSAENSAVKPRSDVCSERANAQTFWLTLIRDVLGVDKPENFIKFEVPVKLAHKSFIDGYLPDSKVIIEQKSFGVDLSKEILQSDGTKLTPYEQARRYVTGLPLSMHPKKIITCNFAEFRIYDMETLEPPTVITLAELPEKFHALDFLIDPTRNKIRIELELSLQAGQIVAKIYDALLDQYIDPNSAESQSSLNKLCVRLVFCLYAESTGLFGKRKIFRDRLSDSRNIRRDLLDLFDTLNTPVNERDPYLDDELKKFPFVNGGLFAGKIEIPNFTPEIRNLLLDEASAGFNWAGISPTIFGAVFESTLNPETRRAGGMHYTSVENIHTVIDPLFLDDLRDEFSRIKTRKKLLDFRDKLAAIKIFDPACGSGNFLTESFLSLRRLENEVLKQLFGAQIQLGDLVDPVKVSIANFYGIEINDFAVAVAQTALWIAELQMLAETAEIVHKKLDALPLKTYDNIRETNALAVDWHDICPPDVDYIIGNPPFVGFTFQTAAQKAELDKIFPKVKNLDYVCCWYKKAADFMRTNDARTAFVSTNSVAQGETVARLWKNLDAHIDFAHKTFVWDSESADKAHVHCVVIGFSVAPNDKPKKLFTGKDFVVAENINAYLLDANNILVESRSKPLCDVPKMVYGNKPVDGGNFLLTVNERDELVKREPAAAKWIRQIFGADEFINGKLRYCLWLVDCPPNELRKLPLVMKRVKAVRDVRLNSIAAAIRKFADTPTRFAQVTQPEGVDFILIPRVSSERRRYVPMGFIGREVKVTDAVQIVPDAQIYHFGVLTSSIHMAWMRTVCGRLKSDYRYSKDVVYNTFPWPTPTLAQKSAIEIAAQKILDARAKFADATLADLYDELTMPAELRRAHRANDLAVAKAYGLEDILDDEPAVVGALFKHYEALTGD